MDVLQFGGGKDSLACLYLLEKRWNEITVVWLNAGAAFPETLEQMAHIREQVPHFLEVKSDVHANIRAHGWPADMLPVRNTHLGQLTTGETGPLMQTWWNCCNANFWEPLHKATLALNPTTIYRGQRISEDYKSPLRDGNVFDGVTYRFPIQAWTEAQVEEYLQGRGVSIPAHYQHTQKSLDCWCCTAYLDAKLDQLRYLRARHPDKYAIVLPKLRELRDAMRVGIAPLEAACA